MWSNLFFFFLISTKKKGRKKLHQLFTERHFILSPVLSCIQCEPGWSPRRGFRIIHSLNNGLYVGFKAQQQEREEKHFHFQRNVQDFPGDTEKRFCWTEGHLTATYVAQSIHSKNCSASFLFLEIYA